MAQFNIETPATLPLRVAPTPRRGPRGHRHLGAAPKVPCVPKLLIPEFMIALCCFMFVLRCFMLLHVRFMFVLCWFMFVYVGLCWFRFVLCCFMSLHVRFISLILFRVAWRILVSGWRSVGGGPELSWGIFVVLAHLRVCPGGASCCPMIRTIVSLSSCSVGIFNSSLRSAKNIIYTHND